MVSIHRVTEHVKKLGNKIETKFSARKIWALQNCHNRLRGNFGAQNLLAENFVQFCSPIFSHVRCPVYAYHGLLPP